MPSIKNYTAQLTGMKVLQEGLIAAIRCTGLREVKSDRGTHVAKFAITSEYAKEQILSHFIDLVTEGIDRTEDLSWENLLTPIGGEYQLQAEQELWLNIEKHELPYLDRYYDLMVESRTTSDGETALQIRNCTPAVITAIEAKTGKVSDVAKLLMAGADELTPEEEAKAKAKADKAAKREAFLALMKKPATTTTTTTGPVAEIPREETV